MPRHTGESISDLCTSLAALVDLGQLEQALATARLALERHPGPEGQAALLHTLRPLPAEVAWQQPGWCLLLSRLHGAQGEVEAVLECTRSLPGRWPAQVAAPMLVQRAWALVRRGQGPEALALLDVSTPHLSGNDLGLALRLQAEVRAALGEPGWEAAFEQARAHLNARGRGLSYLEEGGVHDRLGAAVAARRAWRLALQDLGDDGHYAPQLRYNLGVSALREGLPEAEEQFLCMELLTRKPAARRFRARAWCGLGMTRRVLGEWHRAEGAYQEAIREAQLSQDQDDLRQARRGLGHTLRLAGRPGPALDALLQAARTTEADQIAGQSWVYADLACAHLLLHDHAAARAALQQTGPLSGEDQERALIARAELDRRAGQLEEARRLLLGLQTTALWCREESTVFPQLFALLPESRRPPPLSHAGRTRVEVRAQGVLRVLVNGRPAPLKPSSRAGEVLVLLLERAGTASVDELTSELYGDAPTSRRGQAQALWEQVRQLRLALGWPDSVRSIGGAYTLDEQTSWHYQEPTPGSLPVRFLEGVYSDWVQQRRTRLEHPS